MGAFFSTWKEVSDTPLLHLHFHVRCHFVRLTLMEYLLEGSVSTAISPASTSDVVGQRNKIGGIIFGAALVHTFSLAPSVISRFLG